MSDEQVRIRDKILNNRGSRHEEYCTLCGVPFNLYSKRHDFAPDAGYDPFWAFYVFQNSRVLDLDGTQDHLAWSSYFLGRKSLMLKLGELPY